MKLLRWIFYTIMGFCLFAGMYTGLRVYYIVFITQLLLIGTVLALNIWTVYSFRFEQLLNCKSCVKGDQTILQLELVNERPVPLSLLEVHVDVVSLHENVNLMFSLAPFYGKKIEVPIHAPYRGLFDVGMTTIRITDIFGLVTFRFDMRRLSYYHMKQLTVLPRAQAPSAVLTDMVDAKLFGTAYLKHAEQGDSMSSARLYHAGDAIKRIHWKKSMQQGALYVKQYELPEQERITIVIDTSLHGLKDENALIYADTVCECAASIALHSLLRGRSVRITNTATSSESIASSNMSSFEKLRHYLAQLPFDDRSAEESLIESFNQAESARSLFVLTNDATPTLISALEKALTSHQSVTLVLVGGRQFGGRIHTLYVQVGSNAADSLSSIG